jgi:hypothetical protein
MAGSQKAATRFNAALFANSSDEKESSLARSPFHDSPPFRLLWHFYQRTPASYPRRGYAHRYRRYRSCRSTLAFEMSVRIPRVREPRASRRARASTELSPTYREKVYECREGVHITYASRVRVRRSCDNAKCGVKSANGSIPPLTDRTVRQVTVLAVTLTVHLRSCYINYGARRRPQRDCEIYRVTYQRRCDRCSKRSYDPDCARIDRR